MNYFSRKNKVPGGTAVIHLFTNSKHYDVKILKKGPAF